jgi:hypothetical protein
MLWVNAAFMDHAFKASQYLPQLVRKHYRLLRVETVSQKHDPEWTSEKRFRRSLLDLSDTTGQVK